MNSSGLECQPFLVHFKGIKGERGWILVRLSKWVGTREPTSFTTCLGRVGLKFFYKFQYGLIF